MSSLNPSADQTATKKDETPSAPAVEPTKTPAAALEEDDEFEDFPVEGTSDFLYMWENYVESVGLEIEARRLNGGEGKRRWNDGWTYEKM